MDAVFVKSAYNESKLLNNITSLNINISYPDKFALRALNKLTYN